MNVHIHRSLFCEWRDKIKTHTTTKYLIWKAKIDWIAYNSIQNKWIQNRFRFLSQSILFENFISNDLMYKVNKRWLNENSFFTFASSRFQYLRSIFYAQRFREGEMNDSSLHLAKMLIQLDKNKICISIDCISLMPDRSMNKWNEIFWKRFPK